jgi:hypothetical protein
VSKASQAEITDRIRTLVHLMATGWSSAMIVHFCASEWGVRKRQSQVYIQRANRQIQETWACDRQEFLATLMTRYETVYRNALEAQQHAAAIGALNAMAKLARVVG